MDANNELDGRPGRADPPDEVLVAAAQAGDRHALEELLDRWYPVMRGFLAARSGDPELAADLTQDTLVRVAERIHELDRPAAFAGWLFQIARNNLTDAVRRRRHLLSLDWVLGQPSNKHLLADPVSRFTQWDENELITQAFVRLSGEAQEVIYLHDILGYAVKEMAVMMDIAPMTIYQRLHRGRVAFRHHYQALNQGLVRSVVTQRVNGTI